MPSTVTAFNANIIHSLSGTNTSESLTFKFLYGDVGVFHLIKDYLITFIFLSLSVKPAFPLYLHKSSVRMMIQTCHLCDLQVPELPNTWTQTSCKDLVRCLVVPTKICKLQLNTENMNNVPPVLSFLNML